MAISSVILYLQGLVLVLDVAAFVKQQTIFWMAKFLIAKIHKTLNPLLQKMFLEGLDVKMFPTG